jgi:cobalt-zinc-cadmium efflux system outer membrane protein
MQRSLAIHAPLASVRSARRGGRREHGNVSHRVPEVSHMGQPRRDFTASEADFTASEADPAAFPVWRRNCHTHPVRCRTATLLLYALPVVASAQPSLAGAQHPASAAPATPTPTAPATSQSEAPVQDGPAAPSPAKQPLTLEQALAMAAHNSPRLRAAAARTARAAGSALASRAYANPTAEVYQGHQEARPVEFPGTPGLLQHYAVLQPVEIPAERHARRSAADAMLRASHASAAAEELAVMADTRRAFYEALRQRERIGQAQENLALVEDLRRRVAAEVGSGEKGGLELTRAEAELARARFEVRGAELGYARAIAGLRVSIAAPADLDLAPAGSFEPPRPLPALAELRPRVMDTHPLLAQARAGGQAAAASLRRERALRIPQPIAFAEFENQPDLRFWRAGLSIPIPLWDRRRGQIAEAQAAVSEADAVQQQQRIELVAALERAYEQYQLADQQTSALESGSLRAAERAVAAAQAAYRFGERGIVEVLDAQRVLQAVRADLLDARAARQSALVDLESMGAIPPAGRP